MLKKILFLAMVLPLGIYAQTTPTVNPLLTRSNLPIQFKSVNSDIIKDAVAKVMKETDAGIKAIASIPAGKQTVANTLNKMDNLNYGISDLAGKLGLIAAT